jgi:hypothetical protein
MEREGGIIVEESQYDIEVVGIREGYELWIFTE